MRIVYTDVLVIGGGLAGLRMVGVDTSSKSIRFGDFKLFELEPRRQAQR